MSRRRQPMAANRVPAQCLGGVFTMVPTHYHVTFQALNEKHLRVVTALDVDGQEVGLFVMQTELTHEAQRFLRRAGGPAPEREYAPSDIPEEAWVAFERLVPREWMPSTSSPGVFAVRGAIPESIVVTLPSRALSFDILIIQGTTRVLKATSVRAFLN